MKFQLSGLSFLFFLLTACEDTLEPTPTRHEAVVAFGSSSLTLQQSDQVLVVPIHFSKALTSAGVVKISLNNSAFLATEPAALDGTITLEIPKGRTDSQLKILRANGTTSTDFEVTLTFSALSAGMVAGTQSSLTVLVEQNATVVNAPAVNFVAANTSVVEDNFYGQPVEIGFSKPVIDGRVEFIYQSSSAVYGTHFTTEPPMTNNRIIVTPQAGTSQASFRVIPVHRHTVNGDLDLTFTILNITGSLKLGSAIQSAFKIRDAELINRPKGYDQVGGNWSISKVYEYNEAGLISRVHITQATPVPRSHTETYYYNESGQLQRINQYAGQDIIYTWVQDRIVKAEEMSNGVLKGYSLYGYDFFGNVTSVAEFYRQPDGTFAKTFVYVYLYYLDNNLYKQLTYLPQEGDEEPELISTRTYDSYMEKENPFPVEILPNIKSQTKLPTSYRIEEHGFNLFYTFTYEFTIDGKPTKRYTSGSANESATYHYY